MDRGTAVTLASVGLDPGAPGAPMAFDSGEETPGETPLGRRVGKKRIVTIVPFP
jgi:hypothetical protein